MRQELIEKAARALAATDFDLQEWHELSEESRSVYRRYAIAALDAILDALGEPDEAMIAAFWKCQAEVQTVFAEPADSLRAILNTLKDPSLLLEEGKK